MTRVPQGETITDQERRQVVILVESPAITVTWSRYSPGERGPDLHVHREHTDAFYVLDGELTFELGPDASRVRVAAGGFVAAPPEVAHAFAASGTQDARWLNLHAPDVGFAAFLRGLRDGVDVPFDSFADPAGTGRPAGEATIARAGADALAAFLAEHAPRLDPVALLAQAGGVRR